VTLIRKDLMKFKYDGKSRPVNKAYEESWNRIFGKKEQQELEESYKQSRLNRQEHSDKEK
jgi:hypothetical protein